MWRRGWPLAAAGALTLLLGAWVSAAGPVGIFRRADLSPSADRSARSFNLGEWSNVAPPPKRVYSQPQPNDLLVSVIVWGLKLVVAGIVAAIVFVIAREIWRAWRARAVHIEDKHETIDTLPEVLLESASVRLDELRGGTPSNAIIACWMRLEDEIVAAGLPADPSRTSAEVAEAVLGRYAVDMRALRDLAALYREARFSRHELTEDHRARAADALTAVHVDLRRAAARASLSSRVAARA